MSWLDRRLAPAAWVAVLVGIGAMASADDASSSAKSTRAMTDAQLAAVGKTEGLLEKKWATRSGETRARVRALYKISRASDARLWFDPKGRRARVRWLGGAARIVARDLSELELLREEMAVARRARERLDHAARSAGHQGARGAPNVGSLLAPVAGAIVGRFGRYRHRSSRATLVRRGVTFSARAGEGVRAPSAGVVVYAGPLRGLGDAVLIDHGGYLTVVGRLADLAVKSSQNLRRGASLGVAGNQRVYMEVRIKGVPGGEPVDPVPLLER